MEPFALLLAATLNAGTVLAFASLGLLINERSGIVNLGAEGMMLVAAVAGFAVAAGNQRVGAGGQRQGRRRRRDAAIDGKRNRPPNRIYHAAQLRNLWQLGG